MKFKKFKKFKKLAFSLSEVLIAMTIIGVIAAVTIPIFFENIHKHRLETQLKSFYSRINNALKASYIYNGEFADEIEKFNGNSLYTYQQNVDWLNQYLIPNMKIDSVFHCHDTTPYKTNAACVRLINGELFELAINGDGCDILYFPEGKFLELAKEPHASRKIFAFSFSKRDKINSSENINNNYVIPYSFNWDGTRQHLLNASNYGCSKGQRKFYCTKLIELSGWQIPKDYPW